MTKHNTHVQYKNVPIIAKREWCSDDFELKSRVIEKQYVRNVLSLSSWHASSASREGSPPLKTYLGIPQWHRTSKTLKTLGASTASHLEILRSPLYLTYRTPKHCEYRKYRQNTSTMEFFCQVLGTSVQYYSLVHILCRETVGNVAVTCFSQYKDLREVQSVYVRSFRHSRRIPTVI